MMRSLEVKDKKLGVIWTNYNFLQSMYIHVVDMHVPKYPV